MLDVIISGRMYVRFNKPPTQKACVQAKFQRGSTDKELKFNSRFLTPSYTSVSGRINVACEYELGS